MKAARPWWGAPWGYRESLAVVCGLAGVGFFLQIARPLDFDQLRYPVSLILVLALAGFSLSGALAGRFRALRWLSSGPLAVALMAGLTALALVMGLTPQSSQAAPGLAGRLGLTSVTAGWPFILIYALTLVCLGLATVRRLGRPGRRAGFLLNHLGLWVLLAAAGLGAADRRDYVMWVEEGEVEWRARTPLGLVVELPVAVRLHDFVLEEYPPKLTIIDRRTGLPAGDRRDWLQIEPDRLRAGFTAGWDFEAAAYIHRAIFSPGGEFTESARPEATPAALVIAKRRSDGLERAGWITDGGPLQPPRFLELDEHLVLVMASPEPRRFASDLTVFTKEGETRRETVEVNQPLAVGDWTIYQHSYDQRMGRLSTRSGLELVYDPWWPVVRIGLLLMGLGAVSLIAGGRRRAGKAPPAEGSV